jgi:DNA-binding Lrp family transcriptional regulator
VTIIITTMFDTDEGSFRMDEIDRRIIALLVDDGRASYRELGEQVGLSPPAVKRRVDHLLDDGVITRIGAHLSPEAVGRSTGAFVELFCEGSVAPTRIRDAMVGLPEVVAAYTVTGEADALLHLAVADTNHLEEVLERIRRHEFVAKTRSTVVLSRLVDRPGVSVPAT